VTSAPDNRPSLCDASVRQLLDSLAAKEPTPGGGAASAVVGAIGCALVMMAARYSRGSKSLAAHAAALEAMIAQFQRALLVLSALADDDVAAYRAYKATRQDQSRTAAARSAHQLAVRDAATVPLEIVATAAALLVATDEMKAHTSPNLISDLAGGAQTLAAAARSAALNVRINLKSLDDGKLARKLRQELDAAMGRVEHAAASIAHHAAHQLG
jgi:formiminotetrahydrofolate cyclodeaminase